MTSNDDPNFYFERGPRDGEIAKIQGVPIRSEMVLPRFIELRSDRSGRYEVDAARLRYVWREIGADDAEETSSG